MELLIHSWTSTVQSLMLGLKSIHVNKTDLGRECCLVPLWHGTLQNHYSDIIMTTIASQNHQPHHCLLNRLFGRRSKKASKLRVTGLCVGNSPVNSPHKWPVTRKMFPFDDVIMMIWYSPQSYQLTTWRSKAVWVPYNTISFQGNILTIFTP